MKNKVIIIGTGNVGLSYAYALINQANPVQDLVLIDANHQKALGEAMDLNHGTPFGPNNIRVRAGIYDDCVDADIVCICAGAKQEVGETRLDLIAKNKVVFTEIVGKVVNSGFKGIFLVATNPVDIMTYFTWKLSGFDYRRVIGSGTTLDTARLRYELAVTSGISAKNIHGYVIGEHGDTEFVPWSTVVIGAQPVDDFVTVDIQIDIEKRVREAAYQIIKAKGNTSYGIGMCLVKITNAILANHNAILSVSSYDQTAGIFMGMPAIINSTGVKQKIKLTLNEAETVKLAKSITTIKGAIN